MSFENVDMKPIEEAFNEWQTARQAARLAQRYVDEMKGRTLAPLISVTVETISTSSGSGGGTLNFENQGAKAIGEFLSLSFRDDPGGLVTTAVEAMRTKAEEKRAAFLRATIGGLAGD